MKDLIVFMCIAILMAGHGHDVMADTVYLNDGSQVKGIVVESYHDHIVLSTFEGEKEIVRDSIKDILYDKKEQNLLKLGDYHQGKGNPAKAYSYYKKAYEINPDNKEVRDKFIFIRSAILKNPERQFKSDMMRKQALFRESGRVYNPRIKKEHDPPESVLKETTGIILYEDNNMPKISGVLPLSAASESGLKAGDMIYGIWGKMTGYLELDAVIDMLINNPSPEIALTIKRRITVPILKGPAQGLSGDAGISLDLTEDGLVIKALRRGSASAKSGLREGDIITEINGKSTRYMPINDAVSGIKKDFLSGKLQFDILRDISLWRKEG
jgi:hypothetical protein